MVTDSVGASNDSSTATVTVNPVLSIGTQPASATIDSGQSDTLSATAADGTPGYTYQWYTGTAGDATNLISGATNSSYVTSPTTTTSYWVQVTDSANGTAGASVIDSGTATITVNPAVGLAPSTLPADTVNVAYNQTIGATGGTGNINLTVSNISGAIAGLNIPGSGTGSLNITGTPTAAGTVSFMVTATDSLGNSASEPFTITVNQSVVLSPASLPNGAVGVAYSQTIPAGGAENVFNADQVVSYNPGTLFDPGYDNPAAALGGLNPVTGSFGGANSYLTPFDPAFSYSDLVEIGAGGSLILKLAQTASTNGYTIGVHTGIGLIDADYPNGVNTTPASYFNSWLRQSDVLVSADGVNWGDLGTIAFDNPSNVYAGAATDPEGNSPGVSLADPGKPCLGNLDSFNGLNWQQTLNVLNGSTGGTWLNLSGVTDEHGAPIAGVNYIEFMVPGTLPTDPNTGNPEIMMLDAVVGTSGTASGGTGAVNLAVSNLQNPIAGLTVQPTGTGSLSITGTPTASGTVTFTVTATDAAGAVTTHDYSITVPPTLTISGPASVNEQATYTLNLSGTDGSPNTISNWTISWGDGDVQTVDGNPASATHVYAAGPNHYTISATATDNVGTYPAANSVAVAVYSVTPPTASASSLPTYETTDKFSVNFTATDNSGAGLASVSLWYTSNGGSTWTQSSATANGGTFAFTAPGDGSYGFYVRATDNAGNADAIPTTAANIQASTLADTTEPAASASPLPSREPTDTFTVGYTATDGGSGVANVSLWYTTNGGSTWTQSSTAAVGSAFTFTATEDISYGFYVRGTDNAGNADAVPTTAANIQAFTLENELTFIPSSLPIATVGDRFSMQLTAEGGSGHGYTFRGLALPSWLTLSSTGLLGGTPPATTGESASFMVTLTDSLKATDSASYTLTIDPALVLSPTTLTVVTVGQPFSTQLTAAGGSGAGYDFSVGGHPAWLTLSPGGLLSGTPTTTTGSPFHFTVTATDGIGGTGSHTYALSVNPALTIRPVTLPVATVGDAFSQQLTPMGGSGTGYVFTAPGLPTWLTLSPSGLLSGTPPSTGVISPVIFAITLTDSNGDTINQNYSLTVDPALVVSPGSLPVATVGNQFRQQLTATGGSGAGNRYTLGSHPAWLAVTSTGLLVGTPPATAGAAANFVVTVSDSQKGTATASYTLTIDPALVLSPTTLTVVTVGQPFSTQLTAAGGSGSGYSFAIGSHPTWLTLSATGLLIGTPTTAMGSPFRFTVTTTDSFGGAGSHTYALSVNPPLAIKPVTLPVATEGNAFRQQLTPTGGTGSGYVFTASSLPGWLTLFSSGLLLGTPDATVVSPATFAVTLTDSNGDTISQNYSLTVDPALVVSPGTLPVATVGDVFRQQLTATGGSGAGYRYTLGSHPAWLTVSSTGLLSGTPPATAGAAANLVVTVTDSQRGTATASYTLTIDPALVLSPTTLTVVTVGQPFSTQLTAAGGSGSGYSFSIGSHPAWLTLSATGLLSGTPTTAVGSQFRFTVTATDGIGATGSNTYALAVYPTLAIKPVTLPVATVGDAFRQQLTPTGGSGRGYVFTAPGLPAWLTLSPSGLLSGTPPTTVLSPVDFSVTLTDSNGDSISQNYSLTVDPAITVTPDFLPPATVGQPFSVQLTATGGSATGYIFSATGLPAWLKLSRTGLLTGTPTTVKGSPLQFTVTVTDSKSGKVTDTYSLTVS
jgi:hypothetical protein